MTGGDSTDGNVGIIRKYELGRATWHWPRRRPGRWTGMMAALPKITFGIIVLNGEPFTRYNLRALYLFAHQIIVVEGASPMAAHMATRISIARPPLVLWRPRVPR